MAFSDIEDKQIDDITDKLCDAIRGFYSPKVVAYSFCSLIHATIVCMPKESRKHFMESLKDSFEGTFRILKEELGENLDGDLSNADES
ncbi:MAG: hypothetical protein WA843_01375 [Candidatus Saccharimonadales bacterium]